MVFCTAENAYRLVCTFVRHKPENAFETALSEYTGKAHGASRTAIVFFSPAAHVALAVFRVESVTKSTLCLPAATETPVFGVSPKGCPSSETCEIGIELMLSVQLP